MPSEVLQWQLCCSHQAARSNSSAELLMKDLAPLFLHLIVYFTMPFFLHLYSFGIFRSEKLSASKFLIALNLMLMLIIILL